MDKEANKIAKEELEGLMQRAKTDEGFCWNLLAFYSFYRAAECTDGVDMFMDGIAKTCEIIGHKAFGDQFSKELKTF